MRFVEGTVRVSVPATSANLGPGFDTLGLALSLRDRLEAEVLEEALQVEVSGPGADDVARDERHLVVRAMRAGFARLGVDAPGLRLRCDNAIPHARGLGSSSAAIVAGLGLARALVVDGERLLPDVDLLRVAADLEGHPDNVAPALLGGFTVSGTTVAADSCRGGPSGAWALRLDVDPRVSMVVLVPPDGVETATARGLLPAQVSHADAAANAARAALLVAALTARPDLLLRATEDRLHQRFRRPAMPATIDLVESLRADGAAAVVSGAGPTVAVPVVDADADAVLDRCPPGWVAHRLRIEARGLVLGHVEPATG